MPCSPRCWTNRPTAAEQQDLRGRLDAFLAGKLVVVIFLRRLGRFCITLQRREEQLLNLRDHLNRALSPVHQPLSRRALVGNLPWPNVVTLNALTFLSLFLTRKM